MARVWREYGLAPRPGGRYAFTVRPEISARSLSVVGVCVTRRVRAIALLVDDSGSPELERPVFGVDTGAAAAEAPVTGAEGATKIGVRDFLRRVGEAHPGRDLHVVVDSAQLQRLLLQSVPQLSDAGVALHFALDTEKWLNLVDVWYGLMRRDAGVDQDHPLGRVRELITHGRTMIWVERGQCDPYGDYDRLAGENAVRTSSGH